MAIHVALHHVTRYTYDRPVILSPQVVRLRPAPHCRTPVLSYSLKVTPGGHFINWQQDPQSNWLARLVFPERTREFTVEVDLVAEMAVYNPFDFFLEPSASHFPFSYDHVLDHELAPFRVKQPLTPVFERYLETLRRVVLPAEGAEPLTTIDFLVALNQRVWKDIRYLVRLEPGVQTPEETLGSASGSCRDSAWLLCEVFRHLGVASRFVSGYLIQLKPDQKSLDGPSGAEADFTDLHAWCEVYLPGAGWVGLDPTSGLLAGEGHLPLAATPDPQSAAPITGCVEKAETTFAFEMKVTRIHESPRVTKPYTDEQWQSIEDLGHAVDAKLRTGDVRLTMGGEPTFVSIDDMDGPEWTTEAVGPTKRLLSGELLRRLQKRFAPGALLFYGQGKWYPGESLPRWALAAYWRRDGVPVWRDHSLIADEAKSYAHGPDEAKLFALTLSAALGVEARWMLPAYEDAYYYLWKERRLPVNVDPLQSNLRDPEERQRLARIFEQGLDTVIGYALPLQRVAGDGSRWQTGPWFLRDDTLYLIPGDSPMGYRLPLDSLPWVKESDYPWIHPPDPLREWPSLPPRPESRQNFLRAVATTLRMQPQTVPEPGIAPREPSGSGAGNEAASPVDRAPAAQESASWIVRTAVCVEPRHGRLHVFLPPVERLEHFLELVTAIEETAAALALPVIVEGTPPPYDPRVDVIKVTPDPGVIEVNMHPSRSWEDVVHTTTVLYDEARQTRLGTEKFMLDGRHTGTGGGNHVVVGGATPADSPFLRRPDLLRSLLGYWHNHPSLSYLFSGLFIGPTSQHPRVDEARNDSLHELEIAFKQVPTKGEVPPWLVDRLFRHLLVDLTGNTHRTEFSIDKLFSPDSAAGRLGLVELRSFEMPPHAQMSVAQQLLLRAAIARFWEHPYETPLVRWGTELHDRFLLPHFVWQDFADVLEDMREHGFGFDDAWFAPHFEFRFPLIGHITQRGVKLELRTALEPWHVLGEEPAGGGTVRFVDSSLERLQVKATGFVDPRYVVTCNGRRVPLHPTGTVGEYVAAVRYRAWQPPNCLQPTIPVHAPLVFDLLDTWNGRSLGGCQHHVSHPGGRSHDTFPVNAYEAESRRLARFSPHGHTGGKVTIPPEERNPDFPFTLDLRR